MSAISKAFKYGLIASITAIGTLVLTTEAFATDNTSDGPAGSYGDQVAKFRQLGTELPTPNIFRNASGAPGPAYWQQQANVCLLYTSPSPRDATLSRMPSSA